MKGSHDEGFTVEATEVKQAAQELAKDLDKAPSGEQIIERILTAQVLLLREVATLKSKTPHR